MACFNPSYVQRVIDDQSGSINYRFCGPARYLPKSDLVYDPTSKVTNILVPCRHCLGCHYDYSRSWANRMMVELDDMKSGVFLTLTYNNDNLPYKPVHKIDVDDDDDSSIDLVPSLYKRHWQLFMKSLRERFEGKRLRFFACGEYGPKTLRPHYHAIIFGLSLSDLDDLRIIGSNEIGQPYYTSKFIENIWQKGYILLGDVSAESCAYVARYVIKKHYKKNLAELSGADPEFILMSRRPGIGLLNLDRFIDSDSDYYTYTSNGEVHTIPIPKAIVKKIIDNAHKDLLDFELHPVFINTLDRFDTLNYNRIEHFSSKIISELDFFEENFNSYLSRSLNSFKDRVHNIKDRSDLQ